jgi:hypothetical protein
VANHSTKSFFGIAISWVIFAGLIFSETKTTPYCSAQELFPEHLASPQTFSERSKEWETLDTLFTDLSDEAILSYFAQDRAVGKIVDITRCTLMPLSFDVRNRDRDEVEIYVKSAKAKWQNWWESTGRKLQQPWH